MLKKMRKSRGFTLVELMIVVAIIGVLAALAIYGVKRYLLSSKTAEAKTNIGRIAKDASSAYQREHMKPDLLPQTGGESESTHQLCASAHAVPGAVPAGTKVQPPADAWTDDDVDGKTVGWKCLKFSLNEPIYYQYNYTVGTDTFTAIAMGDLDGDGTPSTFTLEGAVDPGAKEVRLAPAIKEVDPEE